MARYDDAQTAVRHESSLRYGWPASFFSNPKTHITASGARRFESWDQAASNSAAP